MPIFEYKCHKCGKIFNLNDGGATMIRKYRITVADEYIRKKETRGGL